MAEAKPAAMQQIIEAKSEAEVQALAPMHGNFSRDEIDAFCAGFRRCAELVSAARAMQVQMEGREAPATEAQQADIAAIRHTLMTGLAHNPAIAALNRIAAAPIQQAPKPEALEAAPSADTSYPEGFDASCGLSAHAMRTANGVMASVIGKREWDVPMVAAALQSFAALSGVAAPAGASTAGVQASDGGQSNG